VKTFSVKPAGAANRAILAPSCNAKKG
jgi:hypothetical protein